MTINRREFIKANAIAAAAAVAGVSVPAVASNLITSSDITKLKWDKAACRFCGTGCSINVGVMDGKVVIRPMMYIALSYDHRVIDGRESVGFLVKVKEYVENPTQLLTKGNDLGDLLLDL